MRLASLGNLKPTHEYFRTNTRRIWDVVQDDLDLLETALKSAIEGAASH
jgi:uncharacterized protein with HEPN domain